MPIAALPKETARTITSSLALNEATSVVKELIDNALDARADNISIEISSNTLDVIQVKDNGCGIGVEDRQLLCKRGCTSKIRTLEDLASLGGTFLGFRGEALASVAELSGAVAIITRVEGEIVGSALKFGANGKLSDSSSAPHPVGTTVRVQDFLSTIPVRKQAALKATTKTITNIRRLLHSYAFARSTVRFSFKVLKAKNEKSAWSFAPSRPAAALSEVAAKVVGKDVADQCTQHSVQSEADKDDGSCWQMQALLISPASSTSILPVSEACLRIKDVFKACASDQYFSVDRRPVSVERGLMKTLSKTYKSYLNSMFVQRVDSGTLSKPFLLLQIDCPPDTYDINVEPAKDLVLFHNQAIVEDLFNRLLQDVYGQLQEKTVAAKPTNEPKTTALSPFDLLLARKPHDAQSSPRQDVQVAGSGLNILPFPNKVAGSVVSKPWLVDSNTLPVDSSTYNAKEKETMPPQDVTAQTSIFSLNEEDYIDDNESELMETGSVHESETIDSVAVTNPWSIAKLNIRVPPKRLGVQDEGQSTAGRTRSLEAGESSTSSPGNGFASQGTSSHSQVPFQNPGPPMRRYAARANESDEESITYSAFDSKGNEQARTIIDNWVSRTARSPQQQPSPSSIPQQDETFVHSDAGGVPSSAHPPRLPRPFQTPFKNRSPHQHPSPSSDRASQFTKPGNQTQPSNHFEHLPHHHAPARVEQLLQTPPSSSRSELDEILEFERQKKIAIAQQRKRLAAKGNWNRAFHVPSPATQPSAEAGDAGMYAAVFPQDSARVIPSTARNEGEGEEDFGARFSGPNVSGRVEAIAFHRRATTGSNPHRNRYLAATRNLWQPPQTTMQDHVHEHSHSHAHPSPALSSPPIRRRRSKSSNNETGHGNENMDTNMASDVEMLPKMSENDPRLYLMRFRQRSNTEANASPNGNANANVLAKTGLKIRRAKTSRLPLEVIPVDARTSALAVTVEVGDIEFREWMGRLKAVDEYVLSGRVNTIEWNGLEKDVEEWEQRVRDLVARRYRSRVLGEGESEDAGLATDEGRGRRIHFDINLAKVLKAFVDDGPET